jgi:hypothetical protein
MDESEAKNSKNLKIH